MNGFEVSGRLGTCRLEWLRPQMGHTDVRRLLETGKSDFRAQKIDSPVPDSGQLMTAESRV
jgi:hypothetical protein